MKDLVFFIPAQENNKYHKLGDIAPFGDTTLLQWKISQCKLLVEGKKIYVSSNSKKIENICLDEGVQFFRRKADSIEAQIRFFSSEIKDKVIIWTNVTAPFLGKKEYQKIYEVYSESNCDLLITVSEKQDYAFSNNHKINFGNEFTDRSKIDPIQICSNGAFVFETKFALRQKNILDTKKLFLYKLNKFTSIEIKNILDYSISRELIAMYFSETLKET